MQETEETRRRKKNERRAETRVRQRGSISTSGKGDEEKR